MIIVNVGYICCSPMQDCQFGIFEAKYVIFGLFSTPLAFYCLKAGQMKFGFFWPIRFKEILADFWALANF